MKSNCRTIRAGNRSCPCEETGICTFTACGSRPKHKRFDSKIWIIYAAEAALIRLISPDTAAAFATLR